MEHPEFILQKHVCTYLRWRYPLVFFKSDTISNIKLTKAQQKREKDLQHNEYSCPDLFITKCCHGYGGMYLELKANTPYKKNNELKASEHLHEQAKTIIQLRKDGYHADFYWDYDTIVKYIDWYLS